MKETAKNKVNRSDLAVVFGVAPTTVDAWVKAGCPYDQRATGRGKGWIFDTADVARWREQRAADEAAGAEVQDEAALKRRRLTITLKADELALAREMALVAPVEDFEQAQAKAFAVLRQTIMTVPARVAMSLVGETSEIRIKQVLTAELTEALTRVAETGFDGDDEDDSAA